MALKVRKLYNQYVFKSARASGVMSLSPRRYPWSRGMSCARRCVWWRGSIDYIQPNEIYLSTYLNKFIKVCNWYIIGKKWRNVK